VQEKKVTIFLKHCVNVVFSIVKLLCTSVVFDSINPYFQTLGFCTCYGTRCVKEHISSACGHLLLLLVQTVAPRETRCVRP